MQTDPQIENNKTLVRRFFAAIENADFRVFDAIVAPDYDDHWSGQTRGRETLKRYFTGLHAAFADLKMPITAIIAEGNLVAVLSRVRGTQKGDFAGIKAKGNPIDAMAFQLYRVANGQLAEHLEVADFLTLMTQLRG
ncbi:MAG TPA: ester cyclase [Opitutaceae bacterium]|jgi:predicted SnoaL-like aldol condensation-catalyzing enzyme|nr:ester cyclase [Opitutaceae bacterium]